VQKETRYPRKRVEIVDECAALDNCLQAIEIKAERNFKHLEEK
jgi:hypothetical protein